ncbi:MAG TPA: glutathione S-transferase family protein, partial [Burkholderiaceae bacterium]|nr:glutathione S-transferase family protein [Burkholderiaceae bacterium]
RYVDEAFHGPALQPGEAPQRARVNQVIGVLDAYAYRPMVWGVFVERVGQPLRGRPSDEAKIADALAASELCLSALAALAPCQPHLLGPDLTLADLHAYPMLRYLSLAAEGEVLLNRYEPLRRWFDLMRTRPSVERTRTRYEPANP